MKKIVALDGDGVVFDYRHAFPGVWKRAFGTDIEMIEPNAYHATTAHGIVFESPEQEAQFFECFDEEAWATMPLMEGVKEACAILRADYELVIVSSMNPKFAEARRANCNLFYLPISEVYAVPRVDEGNPKAQVLHELQPVALVDDLMSNFEDLPPSIHKAFINYGRFDCPSRNHHLIPDSTHNSLLAFARFWKHAEFWTRVL
jgi:hypothetical protein